MKNESYGEAYLEGDEDESPGSCQDRVLSSVMHGRRVQDRDEMTENIGTIIGAEAQRLETNKNRSIKSGQQRKIAKVRNEATRGRA